MASQCQRQSQKIGGQATPSFTHDLSQQIFAEGSLYCQPWENYEWERKPSAPMGTTEKKKMCVHQKVSEGGLGTVCRWIEDLRWSEEFFLRRLHLSKAHGGCRESAGSTSTGRMWCKYRPARAKVLRQTGPVRSRDSKELFVSEVKFMRKKVNPSSMNGSVLLSSSVLALPMKF